MTQAPDSFIFAFLTGFVTNIWVAAASLALGTAMGAPLAKLRHGAGLLGHAAAALTGLLRASPTFVVMFFLLNMLPSEIVLFGLVIPVPGGAILVFALSIYAAAYVSDNLLDTFRHLQAGSMSGALLFIPNMLRAFSVLVMASSVGAAIGVEEAVTITLRQTDRLTSVSGRIWLIVAAILFFAAVMQIAQWATVQLTRSLSARQGRRDDEKKTARFTQEMGSFVFGRGRHGWTTAALIAVVAVAGIAAPFPPTNVTIEAGAIDGSWYRNAAQYRDFLESRGIHVELRSRADTASIVFDVNDPAAGVDVGFVANKTSPKLIPNVTTLGSTGYEPLFAFARKSLGPSPDLSRLSGLRIGFPPRASVTASAALDVLRTLGLTAENSRFNFMPLNEEIAALTAGTIDVGFVMQSADNPLITLLARNNDLQMLDFPQARAISQRLGYLRDVVLPAATYDIQDSIPATPLHVLAATDQVLVKKDLHPAIAFLLLEAMEEVHHAATIVSQESEFPALRSTGLPANEQAKTYYHSGVPWIFQNLPIWLASVVGYYTVLIVPLFVLMPIYNWLALPQGPEVLGWLRSTIWLRTLKDIETGLAEGRPLAGSDLATVRLIRASLDKPDRSNDCRRVLERILSHRTATEAPAPASESADKV